MLASGGLAQAHDAPAMWEMAAGGTQEFEVASVRPDDGPFHSPSFPMSADDSFRDPHGLFHADFGLETYMEFAYKLWMTADQREVMLKGQPDWIKSQRFAIEGKAPEGTTKDQYRMMMQGLLAERFGLKVHFVPREEKVLEMVLVKSNKVGPQMTPHAQGAACDTKLASVFPSSCYVFMVHTQEGVPGMVQAGTRGSPMDLIGHLLSNLGEQSGEIGRPVVDRTGVAGEWDIHFEWAQKFGGGPPDPGMPTEPTLLEAIRDQLGLKFVPAKAVLQEMVLDAVREPTPN
jgi:uncharacterized protein (TIGR03435 family)